MTNNSQKVAKSSSTPSQDKKVKDSSPRSTNDDHPSWRFTKLELVDPFGWHTIDTALLHFIRGKLQDFESMTWNQILVVGKKFNHSVKVSEIERSAMERLRSLRLDDIEELISLRVTGAKRIWGIRQGGALLLLWWDPNHQVCPSKLKHT